MMYCENPMKPRKPALDLDAAEWVAIHALTFLAGDANRLGRFLSLTGIGPSDLAAGRTSPICKPPCSTICWAMSL